MKIIKLTAENVKRLTAVSIEPDGTLVTIGGKNGAGKSSVLDSIAYALGGQSLVPAEPIRKGETEAKIEVDLGDLVVTRKFKRDPIRKDEDKAATPENIVGWTDTRSTLVVRNKDGAVYPSPQAVLDKLIGRLSFDPLAFATDDSKRQFETLRALSGLDGVLQPIETRRKAAFDRRTSLNRDLKAQSAVVAAMTAHEGVPEAEISMDAISAEMLAAEELRKRADEVVREADRLVDKIARTQESISRRKSIIAKMKADLEQEETALAKAEEETATLLKDQQEKAQLANEVQAKVPDMASLRTRLSQVEETNQKVRHNQKRAEAVAKLRDLEAKVKAESEIIDKADLDRQQAVEQAKFPVPGLGISEDGVTFNGLPFEQASTADKLRASVAIGLALNPKLKVLLIREGSMLDKSNLGLIAEQAAAAEAQLWVERVSESKDGVGILIEDGHVA